MPLVAVEIHNALGLGLFTLALWHVGGPPAPRTTSREWRVAVVIPTYDEPAEVLLPTIAASLALSPEHETWVLDDGRRPEIRALAARLGAMYLTRPDNAHAKAGNLNHALGVIEADIIAVLDADHVPLPGFLVNTLGYFDDDRLAVVQTPQDFYNVDSFEHEDRGGHDVFNEQRVFYRAIGPGKNKWGGAFWCGTCALVRVAALKEVGGVATETLTEDIHTTIRMQRAGWTATYHNEVLALGLAASDAESYMLQRRRWATGAMQVLRRERPITGPGLSFGQRLAYATTLFAWFDSWRTLLYQLIPIAILATGVLPIDVPLVIFGPIALGLLAFQFMTLRLLARGYYPPILSLIFEMLRLPAVLPGTLAILRPKKPRRFNVTPKGRKDDRPARARVPGIFILLHALGALAFTWAALCLAGVTPLAYANPAAIVGAAVFLAGNQVLLIAATRRIRAPQYAGERRASVRFPIEASGRLGRGACIVRDVSLTGARVHVVSLTSAKAPQLAIAFGDRDLRIRCSIQHERLLPDGYELGLRFAPGQHAVIAELALALFHTSHEVVEPAVVRRAA